MPEEAAQRQSPGWRSGLVFAGTAALVLGALIAVVALAGSGGESNAFPAPRGCIRSWNSDETALADGRHNALVHNYTEAQVGYMGPDGGGAVSDQRDGGVCVVVFASPTLDSEVEYAGQIELGGGWTPLSAVVELEQLADLQRDALDGANAAPTDQGTLVPL